MMKLSRRTVLAMAVGTALTIGAAAIGLANLHRRLHGQGPSRDWQYFLDDARWQAGLLDAEVFSSPRSGYDGSRPPITSELMTVMADAKAEQKLLELVSQGAPGGLLYGLCGLRILGSTYFEPLRSFASRHDGRRVARASGCSLAVTTPRELLRGPGFEDVCDEWQAVIREGALAHPAPTTTSAGAFAK